MRLAAQAKMGYYPTPEPVTRIIANYLARKHKGLIRVFDPCAGDGSAIKTIGDRLEAEICAIELDLERGDRARQKVTNCLITDYKNTKISHNAFIRDCLINSPLQRQFYRTTLCG